MDNFDLSKLKLASSSLGERIKTSGEQLGRSISTKVKDLLQTPTPESKIVDEATAETLDEPNWGLNLRICAMIGREELDGAEIVRSIKRKLELGRNPVVHSLTLDLLETCTSNCEKVFSEVASEKVLEDMVRLIDDAKTEHGNRVRAMQLIRAWGEADDLDYLPAFRQTYLQLKSRSTPPGEDPNAPSEQRSLESYLDQPPLAPPQSYPIPNSGVEGEEEENFVVYDVQSAEEKKEYLVIARNSLDILSSILNSDSEPKPLKDDLTMSMLEKCKQSLPVVQRIIQNTTDDEAMLFDALNLHDELQVVISRYEELTASSESAPPESHKTGDQVSGVSNTTDATLPVPIGTEMKIEVADGSMTSSNESNKPNVELNSHAKDKTEEQPRVPDH